MQKTAQTTGVTFAVDDVMSATNLLSECRTHEALKSLLGGIESCHDYHGVTLKKVYEQPLFAAVFMAFSQHRPLVLTPDAVWITIAKGVAHHMVIHGERLRSRFVAHQGKLDLTFVASDWVEGSPENPWAEAFDSWAGQIREHVGAEIHDTLVCNFSTSGPTERAASQIVMMDIFERYFHYVMYGICGIPTVTLEGTTQDWERLAEKVARLRIFDLDWWLDHLDPICKQFVRASQGDVDLTHWQNICKLRSAYGGDIINGWIAKLFPYLLAFIGGPCNQKNPIFETGKGFQTLDAPSGLSSVLFTWRNARTGRERSMEAIGGLVGVTQDRDTLALRPKVGWAVREAEKMDVCLTRLVKDHPARTWDNASRKTGASIRGCRPICQIFTTGPMARNCLAAALRHAIESWHGSRLSPWIGKRTQTHLVPTVQVDASGTASRGCQTEAGSRSIWTVTNIARRGRIIPNCERRSKLLGTTDSRRFATALTQHRTNQS